MIVLVGFMGAGKTTVGYMLAERLGLPFVDIDVLIEQRRQKSIRDILADQGEAAFRQLEAATIDEVLRGSGSVIALGGGAAEHPETRRRLADATVVHLEVTYDEALLRIGHDVYRPMLASSDAHLLFERRAPIYRQVATLSVNTTRRRPEAIVFEIITRVTTPRRCLPVSAASSSRRWVALTRHTWVWDCGTTSPTCCHPSLTLKSP